jgi:LysM domain
MQKFIVSLICFLLSAVAFADAPEIRNNAPDRHVVVKGDTLWDISAQFFKDPWKWPQIWDINKDTIKNPHWIYPGDVIVLDRTTGMLRVERGGKGMTAPGGLNVTKLSPQIRIEKSERGAIASIPYSTIAPLLSRPLVIEDTDLDNAPSLVAGYEHRVILGSGDIAYATGLPEDKGTLWDIYRPGKTLVDPDTQEELGREVTYLGEATVEKFGDVSTLRITKSVQEINKGDRLVLPSEKTPDNYLPRAPESQISARVISIYGGVSEAGQNAIVTLNKGRRDGLENGHVLALYRKGEVLDNDITLPDMRYGLLFVFRTFNKVAYALVMQTHLPVELLDRAQTP